MAEVEKYVPKRMNKDIHPEAIQRDGTRKFLPGDLLDAENCRYYGFEDVGILRSIKGNVLREYALPAGSNTVIGSIFYKTEGTIIYFIANDGGAHRIVEYNPVSKTFVTLLSASWLNFSKDRYVTGGGVIDNLVIWAIEESPLRSMNIPRARTGYYQSWANEVSIQLKTMPPVTPPTAVKVTESSLLFNHVSGTNFQFAYRFIYLDNQVSEFSPQSKLVPAIVSPDVTNNSGNAVDVTVSVPSEVLRWIKSIEVCYKIGNNGNFFIFNTINNPSSTSYTVRFTNNGKSVAVATQEQVQLTHLIPPVSNAVAIVDSRVFTPLNAVGFDPGGNFNLTVTPVTETAVPDVDTGLPDAVEVFTYSKRYFKDGSSVGIGIVFEDKMGRSSFVRGEKYVNFPIQYAGGSIKRGVNLSRKKISWSLSGTPPAGMSRYKIVLTKSNSYDVYGQCAVNIFRYVREKRASEEENRFISNTKFTWRSKLFSLDNSEWTSIYFQIPSNFPFVVEPGFVVRVLSSDYAGDRELVVKQVIGDFLDLGRININVSDEAGIGSINPVFVEIFKPKTVVEDIFYEIGESYPVVNGMFSKASGEIYGDTSLIELSSRTSRFYHYELFPKLQRVIDLDTPIIDIGPEVTFEETLLFYESIQNITQRIESPTNIFQSTSINSASSQFNGGIAVSAPFVDIDRLSTTDVKIISALTLNYNSIDGDYGRPQIINRNEQKKDFFNTYGFSNPYVQASNVNGLNVFLAENQYTIAAERTKTRALVKAGDVLLAIHERNTSSLYIGEGVLRQGNDFLLAKTASVVGDDRELKGEYGTINPESIKEVDGVVYWWDGFRGRVLRYTLAGIYPISNNGMTGYFRNKAKEYAPYRSTVKIVTGFDHDNDEFLITFPTVIVNNVPVIQGVTWAFNVKEEVWTSRYSFIPECYADDTLNLFSFKNGSLWAHHENPVHNNFYGIQYHRKVRFGVNPRVAVNKKLLNIHIEGDISSGTEAEEKIVRVYNKQGQESFIPLHEFELDEGKWCAPFLKDINTPGVEAGMIALQSGDDLVSRYFEVELHCSRTDRAPCSEVNIVYKTENFSI